jgi:hypothetical protein
MAVNGKWLSFLNMLGYVSFSISAVHPETQKVLNLSIRRSSMFFLYFNRECSAMHNIPNPYPSLYPSGHVASAIENTTRIDAQSLKKMSRMYETGISLKDISEELNMDQKTVKRLLKLLSYVSAD